MMGEFNRRLIRVGKVFIGCALLLVFLVTVAWRLQAPPARVAPVFTEAERIYVTERLKYHGIDRAEPDHATGERYFWRNGQKIKL